MELDKKIEEYILENTQAEEEILKELDRETNLKIYHPRMISGNLQGKILYMICKMLAPKNILEIGTYTGYSAISMAFALEKGSKIFTIESNDEIMDFTKSFIDKAGVSDKIKLHIGDALEIIPQLDIEFDLAFIDGDKKQYIDYFNLVFEKIKPGGFILADNVLWGGKVIKTKLRDNDYDTKGIIAFNDMIKNNAKVENVMLPVRDGISIIRKL